MREVFPAPKRSGFSLVELMLVLTVALIMSAMAIPLAQAGIASYQLSAAVDGVTGVIQTTRYQAIMNGYPFQLTLNPANNQSQVLSEIPPSASFSNVGAAVPFSGAPVVLSAPITLQFKSNGGVFVVVGAMTFTISYRGTTKTVTVSKYGSITVQ
jgi:prepilin-type N-terminal cleavage/methylation domain-containing protein